MQFNIKKQTNKQKAIKKWVEDLSRHFSKRHTVGQLAHEKILNIVNY